MKNELADRAKPLRSTTEQCQLTYLLAKVLLKFIDRSCRDSGFVDVLSEIDGVIAPVTIYRLSPSFCIYKHALFYKTP